MTPMTRKILLALAGAEQGTLSFVEMRKAAGATMRGFRTIRARMEDARLIERPPYDANGRPQMTITQAGRDAVGATQ